MHMASIERNLFGGYGIVGGHVPLGAGAALAFQYRGEDRVSLTFFGDGAANQGAFFEALALAQLWRLPAVFVCENNLYAMGTSIERSSFLTDLSARADGVGMRRWSFDAYDVRAVHDEVGKAVAHARTGAGPVLVEARCYRYRGHSASDPGKYRALDEIEDYKRTKDCLMRAEGQLREAGCTDAELKELHESVEAEVADAVAFADASPEPDAAVLYDFTFAGAA
jgi:pyruvate dehydrogenase E1 component alpha subunit